MSANTKVDYRQLGKSGLRVSVPILGGMSFGSPKWAPWVLPEEEALPILKAAWDLGINTIDTANIYSNGESERIIATFMKQNNIPRQNVVLLTKINYLVAPDPGLFTLFHPELANTREYVNQGGLSRTAIFNQVEGSLSRLNTSYIDLLQIHDFDTTTPIEETMKALHDLVVSGKVRYLGVSRIRAWQLAEMNHVAEKNGWTPFISTQVEHSLLYRTEEIDMFSYCQLKGIGIISFAPLMDGYLARPLGTETPRTQSIKGSPYEKKRRPSDDEIIKRVEGLANKHSWKMSQVALLWSLTKVSSPIVGANSPKRLAECIISGKSLTADEVKHLEEPYEPQLSR